MTPKVVQAIALCYGVVCAYFEDGAIREYDVRPLIRPNTVFAPLMDEAVFTKCLTVLNDTVAWDLSGRRNSMDCIDIAPESVYAAKVVSDPLAEEKVAVN